MNRIQRVRRFRLASLALSLVALLSVSLPAAAPAFAASGDRIFITPSAISGGAVNNTFVAHVITNTVTPMSGVQVSVVFNKDVLQIQSIARPAGFWGSAPAKPGTGASSITAANASGKLATAAAAGYTIDDTPHGSPTGDVPFLDITFKVISCPAGGLAGNLDLPIGAADAQFLDGRDATIGDAIAPLAADVVGASVSCTAPVGNDFSLGASPTSLTIPQGGTNQSTVTATLASGSAELVTLSASGVPADVTATFTSPTVTPTGGTTLTFNVGAAAVIGSYPITVTGTSTSHPAPGHTTTVTLNVTAPAAGPPPATGQTTVTGTLGDAFIGVSVPPSSTLRLRRNAPNEGSVPVEVFSNSTWTLSIEDSMLSGKAAGDRGHMLDTAASPQKRLTDPMQAYVPVMAPATPLIRTLDIVGPQSLTGGSNNATVPVTISQLTKPEDPPGNYAIDLTFAAISGF